MGPLPPFSLCGSATAQKAPRSRTSSPLFLQVYGRPSKLYTQCRTVFYGSREGEMDANIDKCCKPSAMMIFRRCSIILEVSILYFSKNY